ncbi:unnamed protein product [Caenorhabditis bovis]|uniref:Calcium-transporting ATPase n=1 Tax=Caenorhabditis bovis TaxID=2654633 RepID=A0A8S1F164_9PELO|nr:unnamed protein product [Caenorhabditis bovis]
MMNGNAVTATTPNGVENKEAPRATASLFRVQGNVEALSSASTHKTSTPLVGAEINAPLIKNDKSKTTQEDIMIETLTAENAAAHEIVPCAHMLRTSLEEGLTTAEASRRRQYHGYNEFDVGEEEPIYKKYLEQFQNPLILLLLASAIVSILMKQYDDAISITVAVVIVVTVGFVQEYRSEKTLEQLTKLVPPTCHVIRDGKEMEMLARELVPGDLVLLNTGDRISSDLRIVESFSLQIDESSLTGETEPKHKETKAVESKVEHLTCIAFMGTLVCAGRGKGIVISTATNSQFGEVVKLMMGEECPKTPLQRSMDELGKQLSFYSFGVIGVIFTIGLVQGRNIVDMFTIGVSLAVAAIPEGLPIVVAVTLAIGVMRMAKRRAVVKKMPAVETLGCVTVICSDKTGTLTKNEMTATCIVSPEGRTADVTGLGYSAVGGMVQFNGEIVTNFSHPEFARIIEAGIVCNNAKIEGDKLIGQPTEGAIVVLAKKAQLESCRNLYKRLREMPFSSDTKWMGVQCDQNGASVYFIKGAVDRVLDQCQTYLSSDNLRKPIDGYARQNVLENARQLGLKGLRVLGVARGESMQSLTFLGMMGMLDPPRPGAAEAIGIVKASGVDVKLITGDAMETAQSIGRSLGVLSSADSCLSGQQVDQMSDRDLELVIRQVTVFYRASPRHKLKIVKALQALGEVVAMTGDGVNDAVALKKADIGVAMGLCGTDVCKEAADMILCDDDFSTMTAAIEEGKAIYHNITNFVRFQLSTSVAALSLIAASTMFRFENPLNAMQILWINIIMDGPPAQSLGVEPVDDDIIRQRPRNTKQPMLTMKLIIDILASAAIIVVGTLSVFYKEMSADNKVTPRDTTMTFTCFVLFDMWNALSCRSSRKMIWQIGIRRNRMFCLAVSASLICQLLVIYWSPLQHVFQTEALTLFDLIFLTTITSTVFIFNESRKYFSLRSKSLNHDPLSFLFEKMRVTVLGDTLLARHFVKYVNLEHQTVQLTLWTHENVEYPEFSDIAPCLRFYGVKNLPNSMLGADIVINLHECTDFSLVPDVKTLSKHNVEIVRSILFHLQSPLIHLSSTFLQCSNRWPNVYEAERDPTIYRSQWPFPEYCESKYEAEQLVIKSNIDHYIIRCVPTYGEGDDCSILTDLIYFSGDKKVPQIGDGDGHMQLAYAGNLSTAVWQAACLLLSRSTRFDLNGSFGDELSDLISSADNSLRLVESQEPEIAMKPVLTSIKEEEEDLEGYKARHNTVRTSYASEHEAKIKDYQDGGDLDVFDSDELINENSEDEEAGLMCNTGSETIVFENSRCFQSDSENISEIFLLNDETPKNTVYQTFGKLLASETRMIAKGGYAFIPIYYIYLMFAALVLFAVQIFGPFSFAKKLPSPSFLYLYFHHWTFFNSTKSRLVLGYKSEHDFAKIVDKCAPHYHRIRKNDVKRFSWQNSIIYSNNY